MHFLVPGPLSTATGGFIYDRRIIDGLRAHGATVTALELKDGFPFPDDAARAEAQERLAALPDGTLAVIDGLALGVLPEAAAVHGPRLRLVALVHHPLATETGLAPAVRDRLFASEKAALKPVRRILVTSAATRESLAAYGVVPGRVGVVEPGTDRAPLATGSAGPAPTLVCAATLTRRKGHASLIRALATLADRPWTLICAGSTTRDPACTAEVMALIAETGLAGRVGLVGELDTEGLHAVLSAADLFVLASHHEGYGMALAEALARGLPVVATRAGAIPGTVPEQAGLLVPPGDEAALAEALRAVLDDAGLRARLAEGARFARTRLPTWEQAARRFHDELARVAA